MSASAAVNGVRDGWDLLDDRRSLFWFQEWNRAIDPAGLVDDACAATASEHRAMRPAGAFSRQDC